MGIFKRGYLQYEIERLEAAIVKLILTIFFYEKETEIIAVNLTTTLKLP